MLTRHAGAAVKTASTASDGHAGDALRIDRGCRRERGRPPPDGHGEATVLLVTDVADERAIYTESLRAEGFSAQAADGPNEAFALATRQPPDIAVVRIPHPGRSLGGLALLHCLKQHETTSHIPVVVITSLHAARRACARRSRRDATDISCCRSAPIR